MKRVYTNLKTILLSVSVAFLFLVAAESAMAACSCGDCCGAIGNCSSGCVDVSSCQTGQESDESKTTLGHINEEFIKHREWLVLVVWQDHVLPAMMLMTDQLSAVAMQQVLGIGMLLDAKHQLESQRLIQELHAQAHKDYHPSEQMCQFGTNTRSLAASSSNARFNQIAISARGLQRQLISGDVLTATGKPSDSRSRLAQFRSTYCNPKDNAFGMDLLCGSGGDPERFNRDVAYTQTIGLESTLEIDFTESAATNDEEDVMALMANLYGHEVPLRIAPDALGDPNEDLDMAQAYMGYRSIAARRSVAQNAFAAVAGMKAEGEDQVRPYMEAVMKEMGMPQEEIDETLLERPSYHAQMEFLTKTMYQDPRFYSNLYDKPVNIERQNVSMQALDLIQKRDIYNSILRSEAIMSVWLDMEVAEEQDKITNEINRLRQGPTTTTLP